MVYQETLCSGFFLIVPVSALSATVEWFGVAKRDAPILVDI